MTHQWSRKQLHIGGGGGGGGGGLGETLKANLILLQHFAEFMHSCNIVGCQAFLSEYWRGQAPPPPYSYSTAHAKLLELTDED